MVASQTQQEFLKQLNWSKSALLFSFLVISGSEYPLLFLVYLFSVI